jgi:AraC-like DNA-binding protein
LQKHYLASVGSNNEREKLFRKDNLADQVLPEEEVLPEDQFVLKLKSIVEAQIENVDFNVELFCREIGMSHSQLHRKITALIGLSPNKFIRHIRLNKAKSLLEDPDININTVSYSVGFNDPSYFGRVFKKEFSLTPMEWKEKYKKPV